MELHQDQPDGSFTNITFETDSITEDNCQKSSTSEESAQVTPAVPKTYYKILHFSPTCKLSSSRLGH
jgi:hypothetical protein